MCENTLRITDRGAACAACGEDNPRQAKFCGACGGAIEVGVVAVPTMAELAARVLEAVGSGVGVGASDEYEEDGDFVETGEEDMVGESMSSMEETADFGPTTQAAAPGIGKTPADAPSDAAIPGPILEEPAPAPAAEIEPDEDFAPPPPPGVVEVEEEEEDFAPPPPPGVIEAEEEDDFAPPPPPGVIEAEEEEDEFAPPPPPGVVTPEADAELEEDEFAPPPPPPGVVDMTEEEELPPVTEAAPADGAEKEEDAEFGAWELDFEEDDKEE